MAVTVADTVFMSGLLGSRVRDPDNRTVGKLADLLVSADTDFPAVDAICIKTGEQLRTVAWNAVRALDRSGVVLMTPLADAPDYRAPDPSLSLARQVLDRQIIDTHGVRVVRANDLQLVRIDGGYRVVGIDVSTAGLLRRLGIEAALVHVGIRPTPKTIAWANIEPVESGAAGVKVRVPRQDLGRLRPADIAEILSYLDHAHSAEVLAQLDDEAAAHALGEMHDELQVQLIRSLEPERAADILEDMDPDEAADLLGELAEDEPERAEDLLGRMEPDEAADVRELLRYRDECAGGLMTTDFVSVPADVSAGRAIELVRAQAAGMGSVYYAYVVTADEHLVGVLSLRELIVALPDTPIREAMRADLVVAHPEDPAEEAARLIARYNLLALPVVDAAGRIEGIVTVDDAMDVIVPDAWKARIPRVYRRG